MTILRQIISERIIQAGGMISFSEFMALALYTPGYGYYSAHEPKLGLGGDFTTAPELSPFFAYCMAKQFMQIANKLPNAVLCEVGAGSGKLAQDILLRLEQEDALPSCYFIIEVSEDLRKRQVALLKKNCPHLFPRVVWLDELENNNSLKLNKLLKFDGMIIANEVLDALPVHSFQIRENRMYERCVTLENDQFKWHLRLIEDRFIDKNKLDKLDKLDQLRESIILLQKKKLLAENYISEINLGLPAFIHAIAKKLHRGIILFSDYGYEESAYYHPDRNNGTLMCYYQHHRHDDPFDYVGLQDITAHVNFTRVIESAAEADCQLAGYTTQAGFLFGCGVLDMLSLFDNDAIQQYQQSQLIKKLLFPSQMGEAIKVMGLSKEFDERLIGFNLMEFDRARDL